MFVGIVYLMSCNIKIIVGLFVVFCVIGYFGMWEDIMWMIVMVIVCMMMVIVLGILFGILMVCFDCV